MIDSLEFVDQEYVFVSGPEGSSSSTNASRQQNLPTKYENSSVSPPKLTLLSAPMPINGLPINRQQSAGTCSLDSHCSPASGTSQGSADMSDVMDQPPSDHLARIRLLEQYASAISFLVKDEVKFISLMVFSFFSYVSCFILLAYLGSTLEMVIIS
jgi:serine/threonine-protein kinase ULK/ATG1